MNNTIDDLLNTYTKSIKSLLESDDINYINCRIIEIDNLTIKPMMKMYNKLPIDIRRQFLKSKIGNVKQEGLDLSVEFVLEFPK